jgi:RNA polymerase sigma factor (sigma-70 family)
MMTDTQELLASFVRNGSEAAFRELVTRYVDLVFSTALRLVDGDTHTAEDVTQLVFADLARMAGRLSAASTLGGWLHRHTCFVARTVMRGERRRQVRERQAAEMNALNNQRDNVLAQIAPVLDEAIQELGPDDREAILLRFFEQRNLRSVGEALGINENVAQKRVARAVQELGTLLQRRGVSLSAAALASALAVGAVKAAPAGLALTIAGKALAGAVAAGGGGSASAEVAVMAKLKLGIIAVIVVGVVLTTVLLQHRSRATVSGSNSLPVQPATPSSLGADGESSPGSPEVLTEQPLNPPRVPVAKAPQTARPGTSAPKSPTQSSAALPLGTSAGDLAIPLQQFVGIVGSSVRMQGTSNKGDWQVAGSTIRGLLEFGSAQAPAPGRPAPPGPIPAQVEAYIPVRSLASVGTDGRSSSYDMDQILYESLKADQNPDIIYRLTALSLTGVTNSNGTLRYMFEAYGDLAVAGVTNPISIPVMVRRVDKTRLAITGATSLKVSSFQIDPPARSTALGVIRAGDEVRVLFDWVVAPVMSKGELSMTGRVPLILALPPPAYHGIPKSLNLWSNVEPISPQPRPPIFVPPGLTNLARASKITCSRNVSASTLAKITDGERQAADQNILFLPKGTQWVQLDFGRPEQLFAVVIWHNHDAPKVYHDVVVQVADDPEFTSNVRTLFNNDSDNSSGLGRGNNREYCESHEGKLINALGLTARCVRFYSKGSTESALNEYTEIEVYGREAK